MKLTNDKRSFSSIRMKKKQIKWRIVSMFLVFVKMITKFDSILLIILDIARIKYSWIFVVEIIFVENLVKFVTTTISSYFYGSPRFYFITVYCTRTNSFFPSSLIFSQINGSDFQRVFMKIRRIYYKRRSQERVGKLSHNAAR